MALGTVSYSVYLIHETARLLVPHLWLALGATLAYAVLMWFGIERPLTRGRHATVVRTG